jgi:hypothetical protein
MTAILWNALLGGVLAFLVHLGNDGIKTFFSAYDGARPVVKQVMVFALAFVALLVVRGFAFPGSLLGWLWLLGLTAGLGFLAMGIFRTIKRAAPADASEAVASSASRFR